MMAWWLDFFQVNISLIRIAKTTKKREKETNQYKKMNAKNMKIIYIWKAIEETNMKAIPAVMDTT